MKKTILFAAALIASVSALAQPVQPVQALVTPTAVSADKPADTANTRPKPEMDKSPGIRKSGARKTQPRFPVSASG